MVYVKVYIILWLEY